MLLGIAEVPDPRAQGQSEHPRMPLHSAGRGGHSACDGIAGDARNFPLETDLSNLQRLRPVAVQKARTGFALDWGDQMETRDASHPFVNVGSDGVERRIRSSESGGTSRSAAGDQARRYGLGRIEQAAPRSSQAI